MELVLLLAIFGIGANAASDFSLNHGDWRVMNDLSAFSEWESFKNEHGKKYDTLDEEMKRFAIYHSNKKLVSEHNKRFDQGKHNFTLKLNKFADMSNEEFTSVMNGYNHEAKVRGQAPTYIRLDSDIRLPKSIDWRTKGAVTPVKDQGHCASCWAFSATGSLEGQHFRKTGKLVSLSEQNLVDCSTSFGNYGCEGGLMYQAFNYVQHNHGIDTESSYPYEAETGRCRFNSLDVGATDKGYMNVPQGDEQALKEMVAIRGPVSISLDASQDTMQFYHKGVYDDPFCSSVILDHSALAVGYGTTQDGRDYWLVKNSWSAKWGEDGYIRIARNEHNMCGVATWALIPLV